MARSLSLNDIAHQIQAFNTAGRFNSKALETLGRSFVETGVLPTMPDMQSLVTEKFLPGS